MKADEREIRRKRVQDGNFIRYFKPSNQVVAIMLGAVVAALIATSGIALYLSYEHEKYVDRVQEEMIKILSSEAITFYDLYQNIFPPVSHELLREALYDGVEEGLIGYRPIRLQSNGKTMSVKVFYAR